MIDIRELKQGKHKLYIWPSREADGNHESSTKSRIFINDEWTKIEKALKNYDRGFLTKVPWLDPLTFEQISALHKVLRIMNEGNFERKQILLLCHRTSKI